MSEPTSGPWTLDPADLGIVLGPSGRPIQTRGSGCVTGDGEEYANALLIAAAPDLLAALNATGVLDLNPDFWLAKQIAAALKKAEGAA